MNGFLINQKTMAMLNRGISLLLLVMSILLISCKKEWTKEEIAQIEKERSEKAMKKRADYFSYSKKLMGEKEYFSIYKKANDTIANWVANKLEHFLCTSYQVDSLLCFNRDKNRLRGAFLERYEMEIVVNDCIRYFYGVKINGKWYFYIGELLALPREYYQDDIHKPLSFEKMKEIAIEEILSGYLIEETSDNDPKKMKYRINERPFISMEYRNRDGTFGSCQDCKTFEEYVIYLINDNWKNRADSIQ
jgi:hypothetical protein